MQLKLGYDDSVVECTGIENGALVAGMLAASNPRATRGSVGAILAAATTSAVKTDGSLVEFTFRVKAAGDAKLTLAEALLADMDGKAMPLSYSLPALIAQGSGSDSCSGSGSDAESRARTIRSPRMIRNLRMKTSPRMRKSLRMARRRKSSPAPSAT